MCVCTYIIYTYIYIYTHVNIYTQYTYIPTPIRANLQIGTLPYLQIMPARHLWEVCAIVKVTWMHTVLSA